MPKTWLIHWQITCIFGPPSTYYNSLWRHLYRCLLADNGQGFVTRDEEVAALTPGRGAVTLRLWADCLHTYATVN